MTQPPPTGGYGLIFMVDNLVVTPGGGTPTPTPIVAPMGTPTPTTCTGRCSSMAQATSDRKGAAHSAASHDIGVASSFDAA